MSNGIKPWHQVVKLREDVKSGELTLPMFAADPYDVKMGTAKSVYRDPMEFFTLTFPASGIRALGAGRCMTSQWPILAKVKQGLECNRGPHVAEAVIARAADGGR